MTPEQHTTFLTLPNTRCVDIRTAKGFALVFFLEKTTDFEVCPHCCVKSFTVYDRRLVTLTDAPIRNGTVRLVVRKRRFKCPKCEKPFTEPLEGVRKGGRKTERFKQMVCSASQKYLNLETVRREFHCSTSSLYTYVYGQFKRRLGAHSYPWPEVIGIDEHAFKYDSRHRETVWNTVIVDHENHKVFELVEGRTVAQLKRSLEPTRGRENVRVVTMDLSVSFKSAVQELFPQAQIVADRFHVIRLFQEALKVCVRTLFPPKERPAITRSLFTNQENLKPQRRAQLNEWLLAYPKLSVLHRAKEEMRGIFRSRLIYERKREKFVRLLDELAKSPHAELRSLRATLFKWRIEILAAMRMKWSNGRLEGYNAKAKLIKRTAYGFKNFENFRLRFRNACL